MRRLYKELHTRLGGRGSSLTLGCAVGEPPPQPPPMLVGELGDVRRRWPALRPRLAPVLGGDGVDGADAYVARLGAMAAHAAGNALHSPGKKIDWHATGKY